LERSILFSASAAFSPQKLTADQTLAPDSGMPVLTVDEVIAQAVANNTVYE
jgi:hypothetical protein